MTQKAQVLAKLEELGGCATLGRLYESLDFSAWNTKTPEATVRRIVQTADECYKIFPGLWGLKSMAGKIGRIANPNDGKFTHAYFQGLVCEIGKMREFTTFVPAQDQSKMFLERTLKQTADMTALPGFTFPALLQRAKTVDVIWFRKNKMPDSFYEIEHTTDIRNSIGKFCDLRDFHSRFCIVAPSRREPAFRKILDSNGVFSEMRDRIKFCSYETLGKQYEAMLKISRLKQKI